MGKSNTKKSNSTLLFSFPIYFEKNWVATVMQKFITSFLCLAYHTILPPPPTPLIAGILNN